MKDLTFGISESKGKSFRLGLFVFNIECIRDTIFQLRTRTFLGQESYLVFLF